jgi:hypothetical protein
MIWRAVSARPIARHVIMNPRSLSLMTFLTWRAISARHYIAAVAAKTEGSAPADLRALSAVGPGGCCSPHPDMPIDSINEGLERGY